MKVPESLVWFALLNFLLTSLEGVSGPQAQGVHPPTPPLQLAELSLKHRGGWGRHNSDSDSDNIRSERDQLSPSS